MKPKDEAVSLTVGDAIARAEAWNERAALLSTMAFELTSMFGGPDHDTNPPYLIKRLTGGASAANPAHVEGLQFELFAAAKQARAQARSILALAANADFDAGTTGLSGDDVMPPVDHVSVEIPSSGDEIVANPRKPTPHRKYEVASVFIEEKEQAEHQQQGDETPEDRPRPRRPKRDRS